jgi:hypothetical protein
MGKYYFIFVWGGVDPSVHGPYSTPEERYAAVLESVRENGDEHGYFWLDTENGIEVGSYSGVDLEVEEED